MKKITQRICAVLCSVCLFAGNLSGIVTPAYADINSTFEIDKDHVLVKYNGIGGNITIPNGVVTIGHKAFSGCSNLQSVKMPNTVKSIEYSAFDSCSGLKEVRLSSNLKAIKDSAFWGCGKLEKITLPKSVNEIGTTAFTICENLQAIYIPKTVKKIGSYAIGFLYYGDYTPTIDTVIMGEKNSEAMKYSQKYNIQFFTQSDLKCKLTNLKHKNSKKIVANWSKNPLVSGYQIQYAIDKKFSKSVKTKDISNNSYTISSAKKNRTYYVRIRGYRTISDKKYYSAWSNVKKIN